MEAQPYIPGLKAADPGPLSRFIPPLEEGTISTWLSRHVPPGSWLIDPFGFAPRVAIEAARAGYRVLVTVNNPVTRFLIGDGGEPSRRIGLQGCACGSRRLEKRRRAAGNSFAITLCYEHVKNADTKFWRNSFIWRKGESEPYARIYECGECGDAGERAVTQEDIERAKKIASTDSLHRSRGARTRGFVG